VKFVFYPSNLKKQPFFLITPKSREGPNPHPASPSDAHGQRVKQSRMQPWESVGQKPDSKHAAKPEKFSGKPSSVSTSKDLIQHDLSKTKIMSYSTDFGSQRLAKSLLP